MEDTIKSPNYKNIGKHQMAPELIEIALVNLLTLTSLRFYCRPDAVGDNISASFDPVDIRGRSSQYYGYNFTGPRSTSLEVKVHEDYLIGYDNIIDFTNKLRALAYPEYGNFVRPPRCYVWIGENLGGLCIVEDVSVNWSPPIRDNRYITADVSLSLKILQPQAPSASWIEQNAYN